MLHHLKPTGTMATVLANGSLSSQSGGEGDIRKNLVKKDLVECIVALPGQLFFTTQIPVCLWFLTKDKSGQSVKSERSQRARNGEVLFIDARKLGSMTSRTNKELTDADLARITDTYHAWRGEPLESPYEDIPGFCASVALEQIVGNGFVLTPGRYVGAADAEDDGEDIDVKVNRLTNLLLTALDESARLDAAIRMQLERIQ